MVTKLKLLSAANRWFLAAFVLLAFAIIYTAIFSTGALLNLTLRTQQLLLHRPLTGVDCVFREWKPLGDPAFSVFFTLVLSIVCLWLRYRSRVLPYLALLLLLGVGIEV